jgi:hypothetical protein
MLWYFEFLTVVELRVQVFLGCDCLKADWFLTYGENVVPVPSGSGSPEREAMMFGCSTISKKT